MTEMLAQARRALQTGQARAAVQLLRSMATTPEAQLLLTEAFLLLGQYPAAAQSLPQHDDTARQALAARIELAQKRASATALWKTGHFASGKKLYADIHAREAELRDQYQPVLMADPGDDDAWKLLVDVAGNYRLSVALAGALPDATNLSRAYLATVTGDAEHPTQAYRHVTTACFHLPGAWPNTVQICASVTPSPRSFQPSRFGNEQPALQPAALLPRHSLKLHNALAYSNGDYLFIADKAGDAPWLQGGMWGQHLARHLGFVLPPPVSVLEGAGLGHVVATLPKPEQTIDTPVAVLGYWNNYGHMLHDILPQLEDAEAVLGRDFFILAVDGLLPTVQEAFAAMGYPPERFITIPAGSSATVQTAYCFSPRSQHQRLRQFHFGDEPAHRHYDGALDDDGLTFVKARLQPRVASAWRKIYLSRRGTSRAPENEAALEALLSEAGFTVVQPDALSFAEQRQLFAETRVLIGLEGAGLANMLFMPPGGTVLALRSLAWGWTVNCFDELARCGGHRLTVLDFAGRFVEPAALQKALQTLG